MLTAERARFLFSYDPQSGLITRRVSRGGPWKAGTPVGSVKKSGYVGVIVDNKWNAYHRLAWLLHYGEWPDSDLDHINGNRGDNRIENLRKCCRAENMQNRRVGKNSSTGVIGVYKTGNKWRAQIQVQKNWKHLGTFNTKDEAAAAYAAAKRELHTFNPEVKQ